MDAWGVTAIYEHGPWFWIEVGYAYSLVGLGSWPLVVAIYRYPGIYSDQDSPRHRRLARARGGQRGLRRGSGRRRSRGSELDRVRDCRSRCRLGRPSIETARFRAGGLAHPHRVSCGRRRRARSNAPDRGSQPLGRPAARDRRRLARPGGRTRARAVSRTSWPICRTTADHEAEIRMSRDVLDGRARDAADLTGRGPLVQRSGHRNPGRAKARGRLSGCASGRQRAPPDGRNHSKALPHR